MPRIAKGLTAVAVQNAKPGPGGKPKRYGAGANLYLLVRPAVVRDDDASGEGEPQSAGGRAAKAPPLVKFWLFRYTMPGKKLREMGLAGCGNSLLWA